MSDVAAAVRGRRKELGLGQAELGRRAGVSRKWIYEFEAGKPRAELALVLRVLEALDLALDVKTAVRTRRGAVDLDELLAAHRKP